MPATRDRASASDGSAERGTRPTERTAFVVGCPRSGTTWVQQLLAEHPDVGTTQETHLFQAYLGPLWRRWRRERRARDEEGLAGERGWGLDPVISDEDFHRLCRTFAEGVLARAREASGDPAVLLEKTPGHLFFADFIGRVVPDARFVHVLRDPRDVVSSLRRASRRWWGRWAPRSPVEGARWWRDHVEAGLAIAEASPAHLRVRYEDLHRDAAGELGRMTEFLGLDADEGFCREAARACRIERLRSGEGDSRSVHRSESPPDGFYGRGEAGGWRRDLGRGEVAAVEAVAGDLMDRVGYERVSPAGRRGISPRRRLRSVVSGLRDAVDRGFGALLRRL